MKQGLDLIDAELYFAEQIAKASGTNLVGVFDGVCSPRDRTRNFRAAIIRHGLGPRALGRHNGKPETFQGFFERLYQQPL